MALSFRQSEILDIAKAQVRVAKAIIRQARRTFLVCDHSKLARSAPVRLASLREISEVFTDLPLPDDLAQRCREWQTKINLP